MNDQRIRLLFHETTPALYDASWMSNNPNKAFIISLGAGPWKYNRRYYVQRSALNWYKSLQVDDIFDIDSQIIKNIYPFKWQNSFLYNMIISLKKENISFKDKCSYWKLHTNTWDEIEENLFDLFDMCKTKKEGTKVLWMFARDFLSLPSFPIDRHIKRTLQAYGLPLSSWEITKLCFDIRIDPSDLNRRIFGIDGMNPDWSDEK